MKFRRGTYKAIEESKEFGLNGNILIEALSLVQISLAYSASCASSYYCMPPIFSLSPAASPFLPLAGGVLSGQESPLKRPQFVSNVTNGNLQELVRKKEQSHTGKRIQDHSTTCLLLSTKFSVKRTFSVNEQHM